MSNAPTECLLLVDPPANGAWNMAVDEALLEDVTRTGQPVLRFYQWKSPTLSLGYFQSVADRESHTASTSADVVRRLSGGGAILHDLELTYSFILPAYHPLANETQQLYDCVHQTIVEELRTHLPDGPDNWQPALCDEPSNLAAKEEPFLCFLRRSKGDILLRKNGVEDSTDHKVVGSAQRRRRGTVLQHGSIILNQSPAAPEISGINELCDTKLTARELLETLPAQLAQNAGLSLHVTKLTAELVEKSQELSQTKYGSPKWTGRR